jgi:hypothetical protein
MDKRREGCHLELIPSPSPSSPAETPLHPARPRPQLRLVTASDAAPGSNRRSRRGKGVQLRMFPSKEHLGAALLGFFHMFQASGAPFAAMLAQVRPTWLLDLRPVARFNLDHLTRRSAFALFDQYGIRYCDLATQFSLDDRRDPRLVSGTFAAELGRLLASTRGPGVRGPIVFLVDDPEVIRIGLDVFPTSLRPAPKGGWQAHVFDPRTERHA